MGRAVVTGGAGFIGSHLVRALLAAGDDVVVLDRLDHAPLDPALLADPRVEFHRMDVRDRRSLRRVLSAGSARVFHLAALHYVPWCERHPGATAEVNVGGTAAILAVLRDLPHSAVVLASSASIYGFHDEPIDEHTRPAPVGAYGRSKLGAEGLLHEHHRLRPDVISIAARLFNVYGPGETNPHVIPEIVSCAHRSEPVRLGNLWPKRDYVHVYDVVRALMALSEATSATSRATEALTANVCTGTGTTVDDLVDAVGSAIGRPLDVLVEAGRRRHGDGHLVGSSALIRSLVRWEAEVPLAAGVADLVLSQPVSHRARRG